MNQQSSGDSLDSTAIVAVLLLIVLAGAAGGWFLFNKQRRAMEQALMAEQEAQEMAELTRLKAEKMARGAQEHAEKARLNEQQAKQRIIMAEAELRQAGAAIDAENDGALQIESDDEQSALAGLHFLVGHWASEDGNLLSEELWLSPRSGVMHGLNRSTGESAKPAFQYLRIEATEADIVFFASPMGQDETAYPLKESSNGQVIFENPKQDFPRTISYQLVNGQLQSSIEGIVNDQPQTQQRQWKPVR